jgi:proline iminopeptidase
MDTPARHPVRAEAPGGDLVGWVEGSGPPVLLLHGGPGFSYRYLDPLVDELRPDYRLASFQQRGLAPSTTEGPFTMARAVADVGLVLDTLGWDRAFVVGHSWGGHLLFHLSLVAPGRLLGALAVDPLGGVADGGLASFQRELARRTPVAVRERAIGLVMQAAAGRGTAEELVEGLRLFWPAYCADHLSAPDMPPLRTSVAAFSGLSAALGAGLPGLTALALVSLPFGVVAGGASPVPVDQAAAATAALIPGAWLEVLEGAGHFPWYERPGAIRAALDRLVGQVRAAGGAGDDR